MDEVAASTSTERYYAGEFERTEPFKYKEDLVDWSRQIAWSNGFDIVTLRSHNKRPRITLGCERSGKPDRRRTAPKSKRRQTGTKKCDCPFRLKGNQMLKGDDQGKWVLEVVHGGHNHPIARSDKGHSFASRLSSEEKSLVEDLYYMSKKAPKDILVELKRRDPVKHKQSTLRMVYNELQSLREELSTRRKIKRLMSKSSEYNYIEKRRSCPNNTNLILDHFWIDSAGLKFLLAFPRVLGIIDYGVAMVEDAHGVLEVVGITSTDMVFYVGFAIYLDSRGRTDTCRWVLRTLQGVMEDNNNIAFHDVIIKEENPIRVFPLMKAGEDDFDKAELLLPFEEILDEMNRYLFPLISNETHFSIKNTFKLLLLMDSSAESYFDNQVMLLSTELNEFPEQLEFVKNKWLKPYKEGFSSAWTDKHMPFFNIYATLRRCESLYGEIVTEKCPDYERVQRKSINEFWEKMHSLQEQNRKRIEDSFSESLKNECSKYMVPELRELRGHVSIVALDMILKQANLAAEADSEYRVCNCVIRSTHGLPCSHDIANYTRLGQPIPIDCIDPYWKKLDLEPLRKTAEPGVDDRIKRPRMETSPPTLSGIEGSEHRSSPFTGPSVHLQPERQPQEEVHRVESIDLFRNAFPIAFREYIIDVNDVARDGHCGFRAIASLVYHSDDHWIRVRKDLIDELKQNTGHYAQLLGSDQRIDELLHSLAYFEPTCPEKKHWMTMPDMGHIIASCYSVVLIHLSVSLVHCSTFFPRTVPTVRMIPGEIVIGFYKEHFVEVFMKLGHPMPPPAAALIKRKVEPHSLTDWERIQIDRSTQWASRYNSRIEDFYKIFSSLDEHPRVASQNDLVVLDHDSAI